MPIEKTFGTRVATGVRDSAKPVGMVFREAKDAIEKTGFAKRSWHAVARVATIGMLAAVLAGAETPGGVDSGKIGNSQASIIKKAGENSATQTKKKPRPSKEEQEKLDKELLSACIDIEELPFEIFTSEDKSEVIKKIIKIQQSVRCGLCLTKGANPNTKDKYGRTALMWAAKGMNFETCQLLIVGSADVNARDKGGETALMYAAKKGCFGICQLLIGRDADVNARDNDGETALMYAASTPNIEICKFLVEKGADVNARNKDGKTALDYTIENNQTKTAAYLKSVGAKE